MSRGELVVYVCFRIGGRVVSLLAKFPTCCRFYDVFLNVFIISRFTKQINFHINWVKSCCSSVSVHTQDKQHFRINSKRYSSIQSISQSMLRSTSVSLTSLANPKQATHWLKTQGVMQAHSLSAKSNAMSFIIVVADLSARSGPNRCPAQWLIHNRLAERANERGRESTQFTNLMNLKQCSRGVNWTVRQLVGGSPGHMSCRRCRGELRAQSSCP